MTGFADTIEAVRAIHERALGPGASRSGGR